MNYDTLHNEYLPFSPMPKSAGSCKKMIGDILRGLEWGQNTDIPLLRWLASYSDNVTISVDDITHFVVEPNVGSGFITIAHFAGGDQTGFSYSQPISDYYRFCNTGHVKTLEEKYEDILRGTLRRAVEYQCARWELAHPAPGGQFARDHAYPDTFSALVSRFRRDLANGGEVEAHVGIHPGTRESHFMNTVADREVLRKWRVFHEKNARLRWLEKSVNSAISDRDPVVCGYDNLDAGTKIPAEKRGFGAKLRY